MSTRAVAGSTAGPRFGLTDEQGAGDGALPSVSAPVSLGRWRPSRVGVAAFLTGLVITAALVVTSAVLYNRNERRLLNLRVREVSLVLSATAPAIETPLASAAELADATDGNPQRFRAFMAPYVGPGRQFTSVSLWRLGGSPLAPSTVLGSAPLLASMPQRAQRFLVHSTRPGVLNLTSFLNSPRPALGFDFRAPGSPHGFVVYAEDPLPASRRSKLEKNTAFSDLNYALYLGRTERTSDMLVTSLKHLPITARHASDAVPFGAGVFTIVVSPNGSLGGTFFQRLPWIIAVAGVLLSLAAALMTDRLAYRRRYAEQLVGVLDRVAAENREMYTEQRSIAQTLQHALLPDALPQFDGLQVGARYVPAASGIDVGGDWYDIVAAGEDQVLVMIGDVSGHGLRAATTMASLRHAALAYASQDPRPSAVLGQLSSFIEGGGAHDYFATMLCVLVDVAAHRLTLASAGHLSPLLLDGAGGRFLEVNANVPIGVARTSPYVETSVSVQSNATLIAFTDGLVERRGEVLDVGLERLQGEATSRQLPLDDLLGALAQGLASEGYQDDTAIVGIRWQS